jgi:2-methylcitrate dehydratase PrpD
VSVPPPASSRQLRLMLIVTAVGAAMLLGLGMFVMRSGPGGFTRRREDDPEALALAVAALDAAYAGLSAPTEQQKAEHYLARARLKGRLTNALAKRDGLR